MEQEQTQQTPAGLGIGRIGGLADGVFSIAMTLLVLDVKVPQVASDRAAEELPGRLLELWPSVLSYVLSFIILGVYWIGHHNQFHYIKRSDRTLLWLNVLFFLFVAFIPFSTGLLSKYGQAQIAVALYGANLIATGLVLYLHWSYATAAGRLVDAGMPAPVVALVKRRILLGPLIYLAAILLSFISSWLSIALYVLGPVMYILPGNVDLHWSRHRR